jgi:Fe-S-cluster containining protein
MDRSGNAAPPAAGCPAGNEDPARCAACGGVCCLTRPGIEAPERFLAARDPAVALAGALASGEWVLAEHVGRPWVDGVEPCEADRRRLIRYPRPATLAERAAGRPSSDGAPSPCVFLDVDGCRLAFAERPRMCQSLEPDPAGECEAAWGRREAALAWWPHQGLVEAARAVAGTG